MEVIAECRAVEDEASIKASRRSDCPKGVRLG